MKRIISICFTLCLCLLLVPMRVSASTYVASRHSDVFHYAWCSYVNRINDSNIVEFNTADEALATGRRGCSRCHPTWGSSEAKPSGAGTSSKSEIVYTSKDLEEEYSAGYDVGLEHGLESGHKSGYEEGYAVGTADAEETVLQRIDEARRKTIVCMLMIGAPIVAGIASFITIKIYTKQIEATLKQEKERAQKIQKDANTAVAMITAKTPSAVAGIPEDVVLKASCLPIKGTQTKYRPYGDYTVYVATGGSRYHCKYNCSGATHPAHFFELPARVQPCKNCVPLHMCNRTIPDWYKNLLK